MVRNENINWSSEEDEEDKEDKSTAAPIKRPVSFSLNSLFKDQAEKASSSLMDFLNIKNEEDDEDSEDKKKLKKKKPSALKNKAKEQEDSELTKPSMVDSNSSTLNIQESTQNSAVDDLLESRNQNTSLTQESDVSVGHREMTSKLEDTLSDARRRIQEVDQEMARHLVRADPENNVVDDLDQSVEETVSNKKEESEELAPVVPPPILFEVPRYNEVTVTKPDLVNVDNYSNVDRAGNAGNAKTEIVERNNSTGAVLAFLGANYLSKRRDKEIKESISEQSKRLDRKIEDKIISNRPELSPRNTPEPIKEVLERAKYAESETLPIVRSRDTKEEVTRLKPNNSREIQQLYKDRLKPQDLVQEFKDGKKGSFSYQEKEAIDSRRIKTPEKRVDTTSRQKIGMIQNYSQDDHGLQGYTSSAFINQEKSVNAIDSDYPNRSFNEKSDIKKSVSIGVGGAIIILFGLLLVYLIR